MVGAPFPFRVDIATGIRINPGDPPFVAPLHPVILRQRKPRTSRTRLIMESLWRAGINDPYELAAAANVGVEAARRQIRAIEAGA